MLLALHGFTPACFGCFAAYGSKLPVVVVVVVEIVVPSLLFLVPVVASSRSRNHVLVTLAVAVVVVAVVLAVVVVLLSKPNVARDSLITQEVTRSIDVSIAIHAERDKSRIRDVKMRVEPRSCGHGNFDRCVDHHRGTPASAATKVDLAGVVCQQALQ